MRLDSFREDHVPLLPPDPGSLLPTAATRPVFRRCGYCPLLRVRPELVEELEQGTVECHARQQHIGFLSGLRPAQWRASHSRLCESPRSDAKLDIVLQANLVGSTPAPFAGASGELRFASAPEENGVGKFYVALVSQFEKGSGIGIQGWQIVASVTGDLRLTGLRPVGAGQIASSEGWVFSRRVDPSFPHPDTGLPQGEGFVYLGILSTSSARTLPERGTQTVLEVTVETTRPVLEGVPVGGRIEWREHMWHLMVPPAPDQPAPIENIFAIDGRSYHPCTCAGADIVFETVSIPPGWFRRGDVNDDSVLDISDAVRVLDFLFLGEETPNCQDAADANHDGGLDIRMRSGS